MFCPECRAEYRPGFTHCTDCDVDLVPELPERRADVNSVVLKNAWIGIERVQKNSLTKPAFTFILHQFIGMYGIPYTAPLVFSLGFKTLLLFGHTYPQRSFYSIVSEGPYFPVQIIFALILGWLLGRALHHRSMLWVWVLPLAILCYSVATARVLIPTSVLTSLGQSRLSHYFGWGCRPEDHCFDQLLITMPFYSSLAYVMGGALARKTLGYAQPQNKKHFQAVMLAGLIVLAVLIIDLLVSVQQRGWHGMYLFIALTPTSIGALLLYVGSTNRRQPISTS